MKKVVSLLLALMLVLACVGCGTKNESAPAEDAAANEQTDEGTEAAEPEAGADEDAAQPEADAEDENAEPETDADTAADDVKSEGVMTYDEYVAAELDTEVVVETYVDRKSVV